MAHRLPDRMERTARWLAGFAVFAARRLREQQGLQIAASLAYTTLLSLVPLLTIMFAVPEMFPGSARFGDTLHEFIFNNLVPEVGDTVREHLREFSANASRLTLTGITLLILIALMLMATIDDALNRIWHARRRRRAASRFLIYWAMITLGPLLVGAGLVSTTYLLSLPVLTEMDSALSVQTRLLSLLPFLTTATAFTLLYALVPDCHVRLRHACVGGIVAAVLFEAAKFGFGIYVRSAGTEQIYGALAVLPLFLVWIYASWVIVLFGAHFTYCLAEFQHGAAARRAPEGWGFADAFMVVRALWQAQQTGASVAARELPRRGVHLSPPALQEILACLAAGRWIEETAAGGWVLCRDPGTVTLLDLHRLVPRRLPLAEDGELPEELKPALSAYRDDLGKRLDVPLEKLFGAAH